jgi:hypothetical protein
MVPRFAGGRHRLKKARGFSLGELKQAGLQQFQARSVKIRIDERRSTVHTHNVAALKAFMAPSAPKAAEQQPPGEPAVEISEPKRRSAPRQKKAKPKRAKRVGKRES